MGDVEKTPEELAKEEKLAEFLGEEVKKDGNRSQTCFCLFSALSIFANS